MQGAKIYAAPTRLITEVFYQSALDRIAQLDTGAAKYTMIDRLSTRADKATNCIHALSDIPVAVAAAPLLDTGIKYGFSASVAVYNHLRPWFSALTPAEHEVPKPVAHAELVEEAGLSDF